VPAPPEAEVPRYRGRFAPSPTGPLHFGSLIAALASYVDARAAGGEWLVRIEDIDTPRSQSGCAKDMLATLERYGFRWDGAVAWQSTRTAFYARALADLRSRELVYPCTCSRRDLAQAPLAPGGERVYPGTCRELRASDASEKAHAWRLRVGAARIAFVDRLQGPREQDLAREVGDFAVRRSDRLYAYQLAVVVDDAEQGITDIVRGADLLASTARQVFLQRALGLPTPRYLHVPVAINSSGEKLSKQTRAAPLPDAPLSALLAAWRFLDQALPDDAPGTIDEFWSFAFAHWQPRRLPPVAMLPAPHVFEATREQSPAGV
jgi:glutamyl-Q tRNA(Asp) synthetase